MNNINFSIRPARINDALQITTIGYNCWQDSYKGILPDQFLQSINLQQQIKRTEVAINNDSTHFIVASNSNDSIVGYCSFGPSKRSIFPSHYEIHSIFLMQKERSKGLGSLLLYEAELRMISEKPVAVKIIKGNLKAIKFFNSNGYNYVSGKDGTFRNMVPDQSFVKPR